MESRVQQPAAAGQLTLIVVGLSLFPAASGPVSPTRRASPIVASWLGYLRSISCLDNNICKSPIVRSWKYRRSIQITLYVTYFFQFSIAAQLSVTFMTITGFFPSQYFPASHSSTVSLWMPHTSGSLLWSNSWFAGPSVKGETENTSCFRNQSITRTPTN